MAKQGLGRYHICVYIYIYSIYALAALKKLQKGVSISSNSESRMIH